jgi:cupin fold WbuC family metalloprotein
MWRRTFGISTKAKTTTFFCDEDIIEIGQEQLKKLKEAARQDPLKRARLCLHHNHEDTVQEMVIVFHRDSYVRPHRHKNKSESFHIIEGALEVVIFDDEGNVDRRVCMGSEGGQNTFLYRLASDRWHTVVPQTEFVAIHETTSGPFLREETEFSSWSPHEEDKPGIKTLLQQIAR